MKNQPWIPTPRRLNHYARRHIAYEARMLLRQVMHLDEQFPDGPDNEIGDALIEAPIVHLRLFDDFFKAKTLPRNDDVVALHWDGQWKPRRVLTKWQHDQVNQHAHLVARRGRVGAWQPRLPTMTLRFCDIFDRFVDGLPASSARAFDEPVDNVQEFREWMSSR